MLEKLRRSGHKAAMAASETPTREQRLAAKLRENLHRRKAQARALDAGPPAANESQAPGALPKAPPKS